AGGHPHGGGKGGGAVVEVVGDGHVDGGRAGVGQQQVLAEPVQGGALGEVELVRAQGWLDGDVDGHGLVVDGGRHVRRARGGRGQCGGGLAVGGAGVGRVDGAEVGGDVHRGGVG